MKFKSLLVLIWGLTVLFGTGYVVFFLGHSGWWWVLGVILIGAASISDNKCEE